MELYVEREPTMRDPKTGHYLKGHKPWNLGVSMKEKLSYKSYMIMVRRAKQNLREHRFSRLGIPPTNRVRVICINIKTGKWAVFDSMSKAAEVVKTDAGNICRCVKKRQKQIKGFMFFREDDDEVLRYIK